MGAGASRRALSLLVVALAACASAPGRLPVAAPRPEPPDTLRVASYNVNFEMAANPDTVAAIGVPAADVVFLQETNTRWQQAIIGRYATSYPYMRFADPQRDQWFGSGMGVLSKVPILSLVQLESPVGEHFGWLLVLDTRLGKVQVLAVHLHQDMNPGGSWVIGYWSTRHERLREIERYVHALDPDLPTLIVGDFNEQDDGRAIRFLLRRGFSDALADFARHTRTWQWHTGIVTLRLQLDHLFYDRHFVSTSGGVIEAGSSDHKPVWADFKRAPR